jgi:hypothetical protein
MPSAIVRRRDHDASMRSVLTLLAFGSEWRDRTQPDSHCSPKRKAAKLDVVEIDMAQVKAALSRIQPQVEAADFELMERLAGTVTFATALLRVQRTTLARLRRFFGCKPVKRRVTCRPRAPGGCRWGSRPHRDRRR